jgi:putative colanic acid biosynthesis glycosyltransferase
MRIVSISRSDRADITLGIIKEARSRGNRVLKVAYKNGLADPECFDLFPGEINEQWNRLLVNLDGSDGFRSKLATKRLLKKLDLFQPNVVLVHYPHGFYLNMAMLSDYCSRHSVPLVFVANDAWCITGRCAYFEFNDCYRWKTGCGRCHFPREYPKQLLFDRTAALWKKKRRLFVDGHITVVVPSRWLLNYLQDSVLSHNDLRLIYNGTDLKNFYPRGAENDAKTKTAFGLSLNKKIVLASARPWSPRKGLQFINQLPGLLGGEYQIVVVGVTPKDSTSDGIIRIERYLSRDELASLYSLADVFANPTQDELWGLVNIEAMASGTPVVCFKSGGVPECFDEKTSFFAKDKTASALADKIREVTGQTKPVQACLLRAASFSLEKMSKQYVDLLEEKATPQL